MNYQVISLTDPLWMKTLSQLRHDVFYLPEYLRLEAHRIEATPEAFLVVEGDKQFFLPYLIRQCNEFFVDAIAPDPIYDVTTPYGYPGILVSEAAMQDISFLETALEQFKSVLKSKGICSAFLRLNPILNQNIPQIYSSEICQETGETIWIDLTRSREEIWRQTRSDHRKDINRHRRSGHVARMVPFESYFSHFLEIYYETMDRVGANQSYYFDQTFFANLLTLKDKINLCIVEIEDQIASACLVTECCGVVHSYLGGTKNDFLRLAPEKLLFDYVRFWAKERGNQTFHMGGGAGGSKDGVYYFKAGFSELRFQFFTLRLIIDPEQYFQLVNLRANQLKIDPDILLENDFFPAYRYQLYTPSRSDLTKSISRTLQPA